MGPLRVSALIIAYNEERKIGACLKSLCWADDILVVDADSSDRTREICQDPSQPWAGKVRVARRAWTGFRDQRNFALEQAQNDWVLVVDADEECTPELAGKLRSLLSLPGGPGRKAYKVRRKEFLLGRQIFHGMWNPSYQDRFFHREGVRYVNEVHEYPVFPEPPGRIEEALLHKIDLTIEKYMETLNRYTTLEARDRYDQGQRTNLFRLLVAFPSHFLKSLFYYEAYKDGRYGVIISLLEGVSRVVRQIKIWQIMELEKKRQAPAKDGG